MYVAAEKIYKVNGVFISIIIELLGTKIDECNEI